MSDAVKARGELRKRILSDPEAILEDRDVMHALIAANERGQGNNIVDLRGIAMQRLEQRLDRLEDTHKSVIAAAYENLAGTNQIHRAVLALLDPPSFDAFLETLEKDLPGLLRVMKIRLVLGSRDPEAAVDERFREVLSVMSEAQITSIITGGRNVDARAITLRQLAPGLSELYGEQAAWIKSEALVRLDLGAGRLPALLVLGSEDPHQFRPDQGTDLLAFFAAVFERVLRRWLS